MRSETTSTRTRSDAEHNDKVNRQQELTKEQESYRSPDFPVCFRLVHERVIK